MNDFMVADDDKKAMEFLLSGQVDKPALKIALETAQSFQEFRCQ